jgi:hypothetical protein
MSRKTIYWESIETYPDYIFWEEDDWNRNKAEIPQHLWDAYQAACGPYYDARNAILDIIDSSREG